MNRRILTIFVLGLAAAISARNPMEEPEPLPDRIERIVGQTDEKGDFRARLKAAQSLRPHLKHHEIRALFDFLDRKQDPALRDDHFHALRNDVVNALFAQRSPPRDLGDALIAMYRDREHDPVWRDYCIQFLGVWLGVVEDPEQQVAARRILFEATAETGTTIAGTALLSLSRNRGRVDGKQLAQRAYAVAADSAAGLPSRITALQVCAELGHNPAADVARKLAPSGPATLRMSALAALGKLGGAEDLPLLEKAAGSRDVRIRKAARKAFERLSESR